VPTEKAARAGYENGFHRQTPRRAGQHRSLAVAAP
jgi:hypothetical protein